MSENFKTYGDALAFCKKYKLADIPPAFPFILAETLLRAYKDGAKKQAIPQETYRNILRNVPGSHIRELNKDCMLSYREQLAKLYFEIESITKKMDTCLKMTQEHPAEISKSDSVDVSIFLSGIDVFVKDSFELFVKMSDQ